jgi:hypothetical protein
MSTAVVTMRYRPRIILDEPIGTSVATSHTLGGPKKEEMAMRLHSKISAVVVLILALSILAVGCVTFMPASRVKGNDVVEREIDVSEIDVSAASMSRAQYIADSPIMTGVSSRGGSR